MQHWQCLLVGTDGLFVFSYCGVCLYKNQTKRPKIVLFQNKVKALLQRKD